MVDQGRTVLDRIREMLDRKCSDEENVSVSGRVKITVLDEDDGVKHRQVKEF